MEGIRNWWGPGLFAMFLNALFFALIPMLARENPNFEAFTERPFQLVTPTQPKPEKPPERTKPKPEEQRTLPQVKVKRVKPPPPKPEVQPEVPQFQVELNARLQTSFKIEAPPVQPAPKAVEPGPVVTKMVTVKTEFDVGEVDDAPRVMRKVEPIYPYSARRMRQHGKVVVKCLIDKEGLPTRVSVVQTDPPGLFEDAVLNAIRKWRFKPGRYEGRVVSTWVLIPFNFQLQG